MAFRPKICLYAAVEYWLASPPVERLIEQALQNAGATPSEIEEVYWDDFADCIENFQCDIFSYLTDRDWKVEFVHHPQTHGIGVFYYYTIPADMSFDPQIVFRAVGEAVESSQLDALPFFTQRAKRLLEGLREAKAADSAALVPSLLDEAVALLRDLAADPLVPAGPITAKIVEFLEKVERS